MSDMGWGLAEVGGSALYHDSNHGAVSDLAAAVTVYSWIECCLWRQLVIGIEKIARPEHTAVAVRQADLERSLNDDDPLGVDRTVEVHLIPGRTLAQLQAACRQDCRQVKLRLGFV